MKNKPNTLWAFTAVELLIVGAVLALCAAAFFPAFARTKAPAQRIYCVNNLKGVADAMRMWGQDHEDAFPMRVPAENGGYAGFIGLRKVASQGTSIGVFGIFRCLSNELTAPKVLICPSENEPRLPATTFAAVAPVDSPNLVPFTNDLNVSYFVGVDAAPINPRGFVAGDHNLGSDGTLTPNRGFVMAPMSYSPDFKVSLGTTFTANSGVGWLRTMHSNQGNVALADGSVGQFNRVQLQRALRDSGDTGGNTSPNFPNPVGCSGQYTNRIQFP